GNAIEHFLEPSFTAEQHNSEVGATPNSELRTPNSEEEHVSWGVELGLMGFSVLIAVIGISVAWKFYVTSPEISEDLAERFAGPHKLLTNKYYVDELYDATVISGTFGAGAGLWAVDRNVVDGVVNGTGWTTLISSWFSGLTDRTVVDGLVNLVGWI